MGVAVELNLAVTYSESLPIGCVHSVCACGWAGGHVHVFPPRPFSKVPELCSFPYSFSLVEGVCLFFFF